MSIRNIFTEAQVNLLLMALDEKERKHRGFAKMTKNSGYGKSSTLDRAEAHFLLADKCLELSSYIANEYD